MLRHQQTNGHIVHNYVFGAWFTKPICIPVSSSSQQPLKTIHIRTVSVLMQLKMIDRKAYTYTHHTHLLMSRSSVSHTLQCEKVLLHSTHIRSKDEIATEWLVMESILALQRKSREKELHLSPTLMVHCIELLWQSKKRSQDTQVRAHWIIPECTAVLIVQLTNTDVTDTKLLRWKVPNIPINTNSSRRV